MSTTGFNHSAASEAYAAIERQAANINDRGDSVLRSFSNLTTEGLQGNAASATQGLADEVVTASNTANEVLNNLRMRMDNFGNEMTNSDNRFHSAIGGV